MVSLANKVLDICGCPRIKRGKVECRINGGIKAKVSDVGAPYSGTMRGKTVGVSWLIESLGISEAKNPKGRRP